MDTEYLIFFFQSAVRVVLHKKIKIFHSLIIELMSAERSTLLIVGLLKDVELVIKQVIKHFPGNDLEIWKQ